MLKIVDSIEKLIIRVLIILLLAGIVLGMLELARVLILEVFAPPFLLLDISRLFEGFGLVLVILIGMELLKSMKMFLAEDKIKPELFVEVALIALCNKVITLDAKHTGGVFCSVSPPCSLDSPRFISFFAFTEHAKKSC